MALVVCDFEVKHVIIILKCTHQIKISGVFSFLSWWVIKLSMDTCVNWS